MARDFIVCGNMKMNCSKKLLETLIPELNKAATDTKIIMAPPYTHIPLTRSLLKKDFNVAAQDVSYEEEGAYTGEVSAHMLLDVGVTWAIVGHSERRKIFGETDKIVSMKVRASLKSGLKTIVCIGETLDERNSSNHYTVVETQLSAILKDLPSEYLTGLVIAYEPVWAIGTGKVATPEQAQNMHCHIRKWISSNVSSGAAEAMHILYGGSVNTSNYAQLKLQPDVDGFLVGGACLKPDFSQLCY